MKFEDKSVISPTKTAENENHKQENVQTEEKCEH